MKNAQLSSQNELKFGEVSLNYEEVMNILKLIKKHFSYWPCLTQILSFFLLLQKKHDSGIFLQIHTGEGKSTIVAMVAGYIAKMWQKKVDIVTSSPILAQRDRQKFQRLFTDLKLSVIDNVNIKEDAEQPYKADVVYGTVGTFTTDILQSEFKMIPKVGRGDRPFEFVIVDEVDSMLIDDGGQFNYLSHNMASSGLRHLEPLLAMIWSCVSTSNPVMTDEGKVFFKEEPKSVFEVRNYDNIIFSSWQIVFFCTIRTPWARPRN